MKFVNSFISDIGGLTLLSWHILSSMFKFPLEWGLIVKQMVRTGLNSLPIVSLASLSIGAIVALQAGSATIWVLGETIYLGTAVAFSTVKELAPLITAVVVTGRVGAAITAEIGTMKISEQIDALYTLGTNPISYLAVPRFIACLFMVPILTIYACGLAVFGGYLVATGILDVPSTVYWSDCFDFLKLRDFFHGFLKSFLFASEISIISCYKGLECSGGAEGVGRATTSAVVISLIAIIISDYFISSLLMALGIG